MSARRPVRVLVVDGAASTRALLARVLGTAPGLQLVGVAADAYEARELLVAQRPDMMLLGLELPRLDGLAFLAKVMAHLPTSTLILAADPRSERVRQALSLGAVGVVASGDPGLVARLVGAAEAGRAAPRRSVARPATPSAARAAPGNAPHAAARGVAGNTPHVASRHAVFAVIAVASSTGGTEALKVFLRGLPADSPGIVIAQHMPPKFVPSFVAHLASVLPFSVAAGRAGDCVRPGHILLAPGDFHMRVARQGSELVVRLDQGPLLHGVRPAADHLLASVAAAAGKQAVGIVLTGMGRDGAEGLLAMRQAGAYTVAQDEKSSVIWGMPKIARELGAAMKVAPLDQIARVVEGQFLKRRSS